MTAAQRGAFAQIVALTLLFTVALVAIGRVVDAPPEGGQRLARAALCDAAAFAFVTPPAPVHAWVLMSEAAIRLYAVAAAIFLLRRVLVRAPRFERLYAGFAAVCIAALALAQPH